MLYFAYKDANRLKVKGQNKILHITYLKRKLKWLYKHQRFHFTAYILTRMGGH